MNAVHNIHTHLNLNGNEVRNVRLEGLPSDPDPVEGGVYFNLETGEFRFSDGTTWKSLLGGFWKLDDDGNLVTDKTVIVPNLIVLGDISTDAKGSDPVAAGGIIGVKVGDAEYTDITAGILDMTDAFKELDVDLSDYYTSEETDAKVAKSLIPYAKIADVGSTYATKASLEALQGEVDYIEAILGMDEEAEGVINTWNEVKAFLDGYSSSDDLASILSGMNADIATRALDSDLDTLAGRVGVNELAIADNAGNIKKNFDAIGELSTNKADWGTTLAHYGITDTYTKNDLAAYKTWWDDLMSLIVKEGGNVRIKTNILIDGDQSATGEGGGAASGITGITLNGETYTDENNDGIINLGTITSGLTTVSWADVQGRPTKLSQFANDPGFVTGTDVNTALAGYLPLAGGTIDGVLNIYNTSGGSTINLVSQTDVPNDLYFGSNGIKHWSLTSRDTAMGNDFALYKNINPTGYIFRVSGSTGVVDFTHLPTYNGNSFYHTGNFNPADYLPKSGGTISSASGIVLGLQTTGTGPLGISFKRGNNAEAYLIYDGGTNWNFYTEGWAKKYDFIHSGNIGSQSVNHAITNNRFKLLFNSSATPVDLNTALAGGGILRDFYGGIGRHTNGPTGAGFGSVIEFSSDGGGGSLSGQLAWDVNYNGEQATNALYWRAGYNTAWTNSNWKTIAFTDSNVASATKLATARTIWGQSFDGTGNVNGNLALANAAIVGGSDSVNMLYYDASNTLYLGYGMNGVGGSVICGEAIAMRYGGSRTMGFLLNSSGNVTIGGSDLAGTGAKLHVDGTARVSGVLTLDTGAYPATNNTGNLGSNSSRFKNVYGGYGDFTSMYIGSTLGVSGAVTMSSSLNVSGVTSIGVSQGVYDSSRAQFSVISAQATPSMIWLGSNSEKKWSVESRGSADNYRFSLYSWTSSKHIFKIEHTGVATMDGNLVVTGDISA